MGPAFGSRVGAALLRLREGQGRLPLRRMLLVQMLVVCTGYLALYDPQQHRQHAIVAETSAAASVTPASAVHDQRTRDRLQQAVLAIANETALNETARG